MGELVFIGLGLFDAADISIKGRDEARSCERLFLEMYTARLGGSDIADLERAIGGPKVERLKRTQVEEGTAILEAARKGKTALLVVGDPMSATTHVDLRLRAEREGIGTRIVHNASIITAAAGASGLQIYKFGRVVTVPFPREGFRPTSPYEQLAENRKAGLHTLVLLDIDEEGDRLMTANTAMEELLAIEVEARVGIFTNDTLVCVLGRVGAHDIIVRAGRVSELVAMDFGEPHHSIIVPGRMHFMEAEALVELAGAPRDILEE